MLFQNLSNFKKNIAIFDNEKKIYYGDLVKDSKELKKKFQKKNRNLCFLLSENSTAFIKIYISLIELNYVIVLIDFNISPKNLKKLINDYRPNFIIVPQKKKLIIKKKYFLNILII